MEIIGHGQMIITRIFSPEKWKEVIDIDFINMKFTYAMPTDSDLEIRGLFGLTSPSDGEFKIQSFELMTNFATADFSGKLSMGFTNVTANQGKSISFAFKAPSIRTNWTPEAVVKLHYSENATGQKYTSYFKCKLGELRREVYAGIGGNQKNCEFDIINPNSHTYQSSGQAFLEKNIKVTSIPTSKIFGKTGVGQENVQVSTPVLEKNCPNCTSRNLVDSKFCTNCGFEFSNPSASNHIFQPIPQVISKSTSTPQTQQIKFEPQVQSEKKRNCLTIFLIASAILFVIIACILFVLLV